jgi:hypothetical protein
MVRRHQVRFLRGEIIRGSLGMRGTDSYFTVCHSVLIVDWDFGCHSDMIFERCEVCLGFVHLIAEDCVLDWGHCCLVHGVMGVAEGLTLAERLLLN